MDIVFVFVVELVFVLAFGIVDDVFLIHITCFIIMLVEYQNEIYRRKGILNISFCDKCPLNYFDTDPCYVGKIPYTCPVTGTVTLDTSEIFHI